MSAEVSSTRVAMTEALAGLMERDPRIVLVSADSIAVFRAAGLMERFPERVVEVGIAEQCAVMAAAGLASAGMVPCVCTYAGFSVMRACEQMRTFVGYPGLDVKFFGANAGMLAGEREGVTHQFFEDLGIMRTVAGFTVFAPADAKQTGKAVRSAVYTSGPVYTRIGSGRDPVVYADDAPFEAGKADVLCDYGSDALIIGCGPPLAAAREAAVSLRQKGVGVTVLNVSTIKPLDEAAILFHAGRCRKILTLEDHSVIGGLGSAVCELFSEKCPRPVARMGLRDLYPESGTPEDLARIYGLDADAIAERVLRAEAT